jgi:hypothetical protein
VGASADLVAPLANMLFAALRAAHERTEQDQSDPPGADGNHLRAPVLTSPGARQPRVAGAPVCVGRGGCSTRLAGVEDRGDRRRSGDLGALRRTAQWVSGGGQSGVPGRGGRHLWPGGLSPGALQCRFRAPVGVGPPDRHAGHRYRWHVRPARVQRSPAARLKNTRCILHPLFNFVVQSEVRPSTYHSRRWLLAIARRACGTRRYSSGAGDHDRGRTRARRNCRSNRVGLPSADGCAGPPVGLCRGLSWWR